MKFVRALVVEDTPSELDELTKELIEISTSFDTDCKIVRASNKEEADRLADMYHYHLVSLDQNIPEDCGPDTSTILGFELAGDLAKKKLCFHGTIFTNVPEKDKMVSLLMTGFQYREKFVETDPSNNCYTMKDYAELSFKEALDIFPLKVLETFRDGGLDVLAEYSGRTVTSFTSLSRDRTDDACGDFYGDFRPFFERSLWVLLAVVANIGKTLSVDLDSPPTFGNDGTPSPALIIRWLRKAFSSLRSSKLEFLEFEDFFTNGSEFANLDDFFLDACIQIKDFRNDGVHVAQVIAFEEHESVQEYLLRYFDVISVIATAVIISQPRRLGKTWVIDSTQLNTRFPSTQQPEFKEHDFMHVGGENFNKDGVFLKLPRLGFIELADHFHATRSRTGASKLDFVAWFKE